jgi:hypothetical protein
MTTFRLLLGLLLCWCLAPKSAGADATDPARQQAAEHFDAGVRAFEAGSFEEAAHAFLRADDLAPSLLVLRNALAAAQRADAQLLIWQATERLLARADVAGDERSAAELAHAAAVARTALLEVRCDSRHCSPRLDGEATQPGEQRVSAGAHRVASNGRTVLVDCVAGQRCLAAIQAPTQAPASEVAPAQAAANSAIARPRRSRNQRAALGTFIGVGASALVLGGLTVWSGMQALDARDLHKTDPSAYDPQEVERLARRSDLFLASSLVLAAGAAATALWWVDWNPRHRTQLVLLPGGGAALRSCGHF